MNGAMPESGMVLSENSTAETRHSFNTLRISIFSFAIGIAITRTTAAVTTEMEKLTIVGRRALDHLHQEVSIPPSGTERRLPDCPICDDTEMVVGEDGARRCQCVRDRARREFYASIPEEFRNVTLD